MIDTEKIERIRSLFTSRRQIDKEINNTLHTRVRSATTLSFLFGALTAEGIGRDVILFVLLYISAPEALAEQKMRKGLRGTFATLFGYKSGSAISVRLRDLFFRYKTYKGFRKEVNNAMEKADDFLATFKIANSDDG